MKTYNLEEIKKAIRHIYNECGEDWEFGGVVVTEEEILERIQESLLVSPSINLETRIPSRRLPAGFTREDGEKMIKEGKA